MTLTGGLDEEAELELAHLVSDLARDIDAPDVLVGGNLLVGEQFETASERDLLRGEAIALPIAIIAMVVILGGLVAAGMPLLVALSGVVLSLAVLVGATLLGDVSIFSINVVNMLGIGLGIDYGLLIVNRFREERGHGLDVHDAVVRTVATAGTTVMFSALTVAVAMSGLFVFGVPLLTSFGIAGLGVVLLCMVAAVTLLPAVLAIGGRRVKPLAADARQRGPLLPARPIGATPCGGGGRRRHRRARRPGPARSSAPRSRTAMPARCRDRRRSARWPCCSPTASPPGAPIPSSWSPRPTPTLRRSTDWLADMSARADVVGSSVRPGTPAGAHRGRPRARRHLTGRRRAAARARRCGPTARPSTCRSAVRPPSSST